MNVLDVKDLSKSFGAAPLFEGLTFAIADDAKVGVIGRNGCGKSTLFKILAGQLDPDSGLIARKKGLTAGYLTQKPVFPPGSTVRGVLLDYVGPAREKLKRHQELLDELNGAQADELPKLLAEQEEVNSWLDHHKAWNLDHRIREMCGRFGFDHPDAKVETLSGGWNQRVALAGMLLLQPELLILDEPTNQLDADTVEWLEGELKSYPGALLMVTHDRYFLDRVVTSMFELSGGGLTTYTGGYSSYLEEKAEAVEREEESQTRLANLLRREEAWLLRGAKARTTKQKARIDRVEKLREQKSSGPERGLSLEFSSGERLGHTVVEARGLKVAIGGKTLVSNLDFILSKGSRVGILGPNGCGKTTLVRTLLGELAPAGGEAIIGKNTKIAYIDQARSGLSDTDTVYSVLSDDDWVFVGGPKGVRKHKSGYLESFLFSRADHPKPVSTLSGGERARLLLAKLLLTGANVLVLDEPTNDLDIPTLQILDEALTEYEGSVLMVTHDRYFLDRVATGILHFEGGGKVAFYEGNYEVFTRLKGEADSRKREEAAVVAKPKATVEKSRKGAGLSYKEEKRLKEVEAEIEAAEARKKEVEALLSNPGEVDGRGGFAKLSEEFSALDEKLLSLLEEWENLEAKRT